MSQTGEKTIDCSKLLDYPFLTSKPAQTALFIEANLFFQEAPQPLFFVKENLPSRGSPRSDAGWPGCSGQRGRGAGGRFGGGGGWL